MIPRLDPSPQGEPLLTTQVHIPITFLTFHHSKVLTGRNSQRPKCSHTIKKLIKNNNFKYHYKTLNSYSMVRFQCFDYLQECFRHPPRWMDRKCKSLSAYRHRYPTLSTIYYIPMVISFILTQHLFTKWLVEALYRTFSTQLVSWGLTVGHIVKAGCPATLWMTSHF